MHVVDLWPSSRSLEHGRAAGNRRLDASGYCERSRFEKVRCIMAKSVFFSFDYDRDNWRVQQVMNMGAVEGGSAFTPQDWESVRFKTDAAIEKWIQDQMAWTRAVIVLVGQQTADSKWVRHEIAKAWDDKRPLVGVRIHGLKSADGYVDTAGANPFEKVTLQGGGTVADYVTLHTPAGSVSTEVHASIKQNIEHWVANAYKRS